MENKISTSELLRNIGIQGLLLCTEYKAIIPKHWDDLIFENEYRNPAYTIMAKPPAIAAQKSILKHYLSLYTGFLTLCPREHRAIYCDLLPIMTMNGTPVIVDQEQFTKPISNYAYKIEFRNFDLYSSPVGAGPLNKLDAKCTTKAMFNILNSESEGEDFEFVKNLICYLALSMFILPWKGERKYLDHILKSGNESFSTLYSSSRISMTVFPPAATYLSTFQTDMKWTEVTVRSLYAMMVNSLIQHSNHQRLEHIDVLKASCLLALRNVGLGLMSWPIKAAEYFKMKPTDFVKYCHVTTALKDDIERFLFYYEKDMGQSWPWCRLFSDSPFAQLATKRNPHLCSLCALLVLDNPTSIMCMDEFKLKDSQYIINSLENIVFAIKGKIEREAKESKVAMEINSKHDQVRVSEHDLNKTSKQNLQMSHLANDNPAASTINDPIKITSQFDRMTVHDYSKSRTSVRTANNESGYYHGATTAYRNTSVASQYAGRSGDQWRNTTAYQNGHVRQPHATNNNGPTRVASHYAEGGNRTTDRTPQINQSANHRPAIAANGPAYNPSHYYAGGGNRTTDRTHQINRPANHRLGIAANGPAYMPLHYAGGGIRTTDRTHQMIRPANHRLGMAANGTAYKPSHYAGGGNRTTDQTHQM